MISKMKNSELSKDRLKLLEAIEQAGVNAASLSHSIGRNHAYCHQHIYQGSPKSFAYEDRKAIIRELKSRAPTAPAVIDLARLYHMPENDNAPADTDTIITAAVRIPLLSWEQSSKTLVSDFQETIASPPTLAGVKGAYAIYMPDDTMEPRYNAGEILYIRPNRPLIKGEHYLLKALPSSPAPLKLVWHT